MCSHENVVTPRCVHGTPDQYRSTSARCVQYPRLSQRGSVQVNVPLTLQASCSRVERATRTADDIVAWGGLLTGSGKLLAWRLRKVSCLEVVAHVVRQPLLLVTDTALEGNDLVGSVSAVRFDRVLGQPAVWQFFGSEIVGPELGKLQTGSMKVITALEVLPVVAALSVGVLGCCSVVSLCL